MALESQTLNDVQWWQKSYAQSQPDPGSKEEKILQMIEQFEEFCTEYLAELSQFSSQPHDWLQRSVDKTLSTYWEPLLAAAEQHQQQAYRSLLKEGYENLKNFQGKFQKERNIQLDINIVLYFEKIGKASRFPFSGISLISVPEQDAQKGDWMSIPHELGHHVFWNTKFSEEDNTLIPTPGKNFLADEVKIAVDTMGKELTGTAKSKESAQVLFEAMLNAWTEEIFADIVGARIAGAAFVGAASDRIRSKVPLTAQEGLFVTDGEHPILYLLPYIRGAAAAGNINTEITTIWGEYLNGNNRPPKTGIKYSQLISGSGVKIPFSALRLGVMTFVVQIVKKLKKVEIEKLVKGITPVKQLEKFISDSSSMGTDDERLKALLDPDILEKRLEWTCSNIPPHYNTGGRLRCATCMRPRNWWSILPFR